MLPKFCLNMNELSSFQQRMAQQLMNTGLTHAAWAFSQMVGQEVGFETLSTTVSKIGLADTIYYQPGDMTLIITDIIGEAGGRSYLLLSERERVALRDMCLSATASTRQCAVMEEAVLKEIDNIVSAAVITKLSELLGLQIFGGVPHLLRSPAGDMQKLLRADFDQANDDHLLINTRFLFKENNQVQPQFFWKFPSKFLRYLENYLNASHQDTSR